MSLSTVIEDSDCGLVLVGSVLPSSPGCDDSGGTSAIDETSVTADGEYVLLAGELGIEDGAATVVTGALARVVGPAITLAGCNATGGS